MLVCWFALVFTCFLTTNRWIVWVVTSIRSAQRGVSATTAHVTRVCPSREITRFLTIQESENGVELRDNPLSHHYYLHSADTSSPTFWPCRSIQKFATITALANRAAVFLKMEKWENAERDCTVALGLPEGVGFLKAWQRRGTARRSLGRLLDAAQDFEEALRSKLPSTNLHLPQHLLDPAFV